jgi:hypothetical protein
VRALRRTDDPNRLLLHVQGLRDEHRLLIAGARPRRPPGRSPVGSSCFPVFNAIRSG